MVEYSCESYSNAVASANIINLHKPGFKAKIGIILGSGLGEFAEQIKNPTIIPYFKLPGFHSCSVKGHAGNMLLGTLHDVPVACLQGRAHVYEGVTGSPIKALIRTLKLIGCEMVIITNAAGSVHLDMPPGSLMLLSDHINFQAFNPLIGQNDDDFGPRFPSMQNAYDIDLQNKFLEIANKLQIKLHQGVYLAISGPAFETPAEIRAYKILGADAVGMSTVPEVIVARHCELKVAAISAITNLASGITKDELSHEQTLRGAKLAAGSLVKLLSEFIKNYSL